jgi:hypothetical protein
LNTALVPPVVVNEDGHRLDDGSAVLPVDAVRAAMSEQDDVWLASCRNFYDSPFARSKGWTSIRQPAQPAPLGPKDLP